MEEKKETENLTPEKEGYVPRPMWQVWGARIGLAIFIGFVILQLFQIARGGM